MTHPLTGVDLDVARLLQVIQDTWNASDMDAMFAVATPDVHGVNVVGMHWQGHAAVKQAHAIFFDIMFRGVPLELEAVEHVTFSGAYDAASGQRVLYVTERCVFTLRPDGIELLFAPSCPGV